EELLVECIGRRADCSDGARTSFHGRFRIVDIGAGRHGENSRDVHLHPGRSRSVPLSCHAVDIVEVVPSVIRL
ncbi:hypothetical protein PMAYCL1PPCAC_08246, partial [Pristionchus mayeri]